ncbi:methyltransferase type 11 [Planotetraspora thailandica]|uniref:Methyltransferase type 11 n=1 Tax=Planotetraspora thailandica TaxID=487172 RepID=A0A8J3VG27_9ACTN|nr:class I SAM-dependent methyltransferase [Planotetraspora thailandica]GII57990.1 methyltransferase type 11 [Planotetraspora thailandica]
MTSEKLYLDRVRALSFGSVVEEYDRYRPRCPAALVDDLVALRPADVLDVACGTGKVAVPLTERGLSVLGVEVDERMAGVARSHGIPVEIAPFESWEDAGRRFDLITCGSAWHWIDPLPGVAKAARLLRSGGTIVRFWTYNFVDEPFASALETVYKEHAPTASTHAHGPDKKIDGDDPFAESQEFSSVETRTYHWERTLTADEWVGLAGTFSDHQRLGPDRLAVLNQALRETIEVFGGAVHTRGEAYAIFARRA